MRDEICYLNEVVVDFLIVNMGVIVIGIGICVELGYVEKCVKVLCEIIGFDFKLLLDLVGVILDIFCLVGYVLVLKRIVVKVNKICNDLCLLVSGLCCGLGEFNFLVM